jgi:hypothetical protein
VFRSKPVYPFYDIAKWVEDNTAEDDAIGVFQCGMIGYFSNRKTINLDGKVNRDALAALKNGSLAEYIASEDLSMIIDHAKILEIFLDTPSEELKKHCVKIRAESMDTQCGWIALKKDYFNKIGMEPDTTATVPSPVSGSISGSGAR